MSIALIHHGTGHGTGARPGTLEGRTGHGVPPRGSAGRSVTLTVERHIGDQSYLAWIEGRMRELVSPVALSTGSTLRAVVVAVDGRLELRQIEAAGPAGLWTPTSAESELDDEEAAAKNAPTIAPNPEPPATLRANGTAVPAAGDAPTATAAVLTASSLLTASRAFTAAANGYGAPRAHAEAERGPTALDLEPLVAGASSRGTSLEPLIERMDAALHGPLAARDTGQSAALAALLGASTHPARSAGAEGRARGLVAEDGDEAGLAVPAAAQVTRYFGTFPVLIGGELLELELVALRDRASASGPAPVRRLIMSLRTPRLGRVQIVAEARGARLSIALKGQTAHSAELMSRHVGAVRELVARLGWRVDSVVYGMEDPSAHLAANAANTLDLLL